MYVIHAPGRARLLLYAASDSLIWVSAVLAVGLLRSEGPIQNTLLVGLLAAGGGAALLQWLFGTLTGVYRGRYPVGTFAEAKALALTMLLVGVVLAPAGLFLDGAGGVPRSVGFLAPAVAFSLAVGLRFILRTAAEEDARSGQGHTPVLIYGAGVLGASMAHRMVTDPTSAYHPVGFIDDDARKQGLRVNDLKVLGDFGDLPHVARQTGATALLICMNAADSAQIRTITDTAESLGLETLSLPPLNDMLRGTAQVRDIRAVSIEDILGRHPVELDTEIISGTIHGKRVLVTGAGGSIGSELCRQLARFGPSELLMLDRDETGLQETQISLTGHGLLDTPNLILADIRDAAGMRELMLDRRPDVVFHAAALKHLPLLERYPREGWKTNVLGTLNVLEAAMAADVPTFVNISTDKAADPTSFLGKSKRVAEQLTAWAAGTAGDRRYMSVRFGNVIGSRGSMLPTFQAMIERGGPVTVTDPEVTRFFMTIPEACQLVLQAGAVGGRGEVMILDMGEPVKILDIARRMIAMSGREIDIVFTGLREGEKLHEDLIGIDEAGGTPIHPKIFHAPVTPVFPDRLDVEAWLQGMPSEHRVEKKQHPHTPFGLDTGRPAQIKLEELS